MGNKKGKSSKQKNAAKARAERNKVMARQNRSSSGQMEDPVEEVRRPALNSITVLWFTVQVILVAVYNLGFTGPLRIIVIINSIPLLILLTVDMIRNHTGKNIILFLLFYALTIVFMVKAILA